VPTIYADNASDLFRAQGFVSAQDRFFEMDLRRHLTAGRLSELVGSAGLESDKAVRTMGWRRVAEQELPRLAPETRQYLQAYADGVNAYIRQVESPEKMSLEYTVLQRRNPSYRVEPWTPIDSLAWLKALAWDLRGDYNDELTRARLSRRGISLRQIALLYPPYPYDRNQPILSSDDWAPGAAKDSTSDQAASSVPAAPAALSALSSIDGAKAVDATVAALDAAPSTLGRGDDIGSNSWVVSGSKTTTGKPLLANDPHLGPSIPGIWYEMGLHCRTVSPACPFDVSGFTFAGLPGVIIGHNDRIAWGFTNLYPDVQDLYLEKVSDHDTYLYDGRQAPLDTRKETFVVKGEDPVTITVRSSRHGPLISDVSQDFATVGADAPAPARSPPRGNGYAVALRWTALKPGRTADALFAIDEAHDWHSFREAARFFVAPSQNLVYADVDGHIGYQAPGKIPIRRTGVGDWPVPGWDPAYEWRGYIPYDALPNVLDPDDGMVVTANQAIAKPDYPYFIGDSYDTGYRSERIRQLLSAADDLTVSDMGRIQLDDYCELAKRLRPLLLSIDLSSSYYQQGQRALSAWDFHEDADSPGAAFFNVFWRQLLVHTFADQLPDDVMPDGNSRWWQVILDLVRRPHDSFWDDVDTADVRETRDDVLKAALIDARDELTRTRSRDPHNWAWGSLHTLDLDNATLGSEDSPVAFLFNRDGYALSGGPSVVDATSWDADEGYEASYVPSMRMVIPLDDLDAARWVNLTGASGHAFNAHYTDQTELWLRGETLPWAFTRDAVEAAADHTLTLKPASNATNAP
jgi:penicillin amidase